MPCFLELEGWPVGGVISYCVSSLGQSVWNPVLFPEHTEHIAGAQVHAWQLCGAGTCGTACMELPGVGTSAGTCANP